MKDISPKMFQIIAFIILNFMKSIGFKLFTYTHSFERRVVAVSLSVEIEIEGFVNLLNLYLQQIT